MRKAKIVVAVVIAVVVIVLAAAWLFIDPNRYRGEIQARLEQQLQRKVTLGDMRLGFLPLRFTVQNVTIDEDSRFKSKSPFTQTEKLDVSVSLLALLGGKVQVNSIDLVKPQVELIRNAQGVWNFSSLGAAKPEAAPQGKAQEPPSKSTFSLNRLTITNGSIAITDLYRKKPRAAYGPIDITLLDYTAGKPFSFDIAAHIPGGSAQAIYLKGTGGPMPDSGPASMPLKATVSLMDVDLAGLRQFLDSATTASAQGLLSGETQIESQSGKLSAKGKLDLKGARAGNVDVGYPIALDYAVSSDLDKGLLQISSATLKLGPTPLSLNGSVNMTPNPMEVDLRLKTGDVAVTEIARLASAFGVAFSPDTSVTGRISGDVRARGPLDNIALDGSIAGRNLQIAGKGVPQPVAVQALDLTLTPAEIRSNEFEAKSGKTTVLGKFALRQYSSKSPLVDVSLRAPGASLPEIQAISKAYGITALDQLSGAGNLNFDLHASGPLESVASANAARSLNGNVNLDFTTMKIQGVDAAHELGRLGGFLKAGDADKGFTDVIKLAGHINVKNGIAETNDLQMQLLDGTLAAVGNSDLASQTLNLRGTAVFSKAFSDKVGGTKIGGYLTTALSNDRGELVIPAIISGSLQKPKFSPDTQAFLKMQQQKLLPGLDNPKSVLSGVLGSLSGKKPAEQPAEPGKEPPKEEPKPNSLKGVLNGILGGKK